MLVFSHINLAFFAVPKTGSTAYYGALRPKAQIVYAGDTSLKHMPLRKYETCVAPGLRAGFDLVPECCAVIRDPLDQASSWFRYRQRPENHGNKSDTSGMSFDDFLIESLTPRKTKRASIGSQYEFLTMEDELRVDHLFSYENLTLLDDFLSRALGKTISTHRKNVSPEMNLNVSDDVLDTFRTARSKDFALYNTVQDAGGYLHTEILR